MKNKKHSTNFDIYANIVKIEKNECALKVFDTREELDDLNIEIRDLKEKIVEHESKIRGVGQENGQEINLSEYELICLNIQSLSEKVQELCDVETEVKKKYVEQLKELDEKRRVFDKLQEKQQIRSKEIDVAIDKKTGIENDDLWSQVNWVKNNV